MKLMRNSCKLILDGPPLPKKSHRNGYRDIQEKKKALFISWIMKTQYRGFLIDEPKLIRFRFFIEPSLNKQKKLDPIGLADEILPHREKPDVSNLLKLYEDCMTKVVLSDDKVISDIIAKKRWSLNPRTTIQIIF